MKKFFILFILVLCLFAAPISAIGMERAGHKEWNFTVNLDGDAVGTHKFTLDQTAGSQDSWYVTSNADFKVEILSIPVFRYHHNAQEQWKNQCLSQLTADTNHDGDISHVTAQGNFQSGSVSVTNGSLDSDKNTKSWNGCLMTFAYWNPDMRKQTRLLNPETGEIEPVSINTEPDINVMVHGQQVDAHVWRIEGNMNPVDVLYDDKGNWIGLNAKVKGGRTLSYRLP